ncbi:MAG: ABC transporter ATP-binding protein [Alphaproteobacteria bacterium]|nr:ABC transporter ATP-binding protein [Alphaproteobacteria bacterium]
MLRRNIGKSKQSNKNLKSQNAVLPRSLWKFYFKYAVSGSWWPLLLYAFFFLLTTSNQVLFPYCERWFIALFETPVPAGMNFVQHALPTILLIVALNMMISIAAILRGMFHARWAPQIRNRTSVVLNDYVHGQSMAFWTGRMAGQVNSQINYVADGFWVVEEFWRIVALLLTMVVNVGLIFQINSYVAIIFAVVFAFRAIYSWILIKPMNRASKDASSISSKLSGKIVDSIANFSVVKLFAGASRERAHLEPMREKHIAARIKSFFVQRLFWGVPSLVWDISYGATLLFCAYLYMKGQITVSEIVFTVSIYFSTMGTIGAIVNQIPNITDKLGAATKAYSELVVPVDVMDAPNAPALHVSCGEIEFRNISFKYKQKWVLRNFNLKIKCGERVGLVGPSGAGKTTLVNLLMRFYDPNSGEILIDGQNIRNVTQDSLRENISFIPQEPTMFNRTLRENIAYGRPDATKHQIQNAAKRAAAHDFIVDTDKKYESMVGDRGIKLSGGQRQRIAIARAFLKDAPILVLDEATSALDSETEVCIQKSFDELADGRTTLAIAHRLSTLRNMDRIVVIKDGHVIEQGTHKTLYRKRGGEYARLWRMQSGGFIPE